MTKLYLASRSPRRKFLLSNLISEFSLCNVDILEQPKNGENPCEYVLRLAADKALAARQQLSGSSPVLAADTEVVRDGRILGKPGSHTEAVDMLMSLSGRGHDVYTAVVLVKDKLTHIINHNRVWFRTLKREECEEYCLKNVVLDKAGAYGIQDRAGAFVVRLQGSYSGVMGLPLAETGKLLLEGGQIK